MLTVGTDIIEVERVESVIRMWGDKFLSRVYTNAEIDYCDNSSFPYQRYAGRFAAKEAVKKALLSANPTLSIPISQIEIENDSSGRAHVRLLGSLGKICQFYTTQVSISHVKRYATATAVVIT